MPRIKIKRIIINLVLLFITIILFIALLEIFLRIFYPQPLNPTFIPTNERDNFAEYDDLLGWKLKPNYEGVFFSSEYSTSIKNNAQGMRMSNDIEIEKAKKRIAFLGDSYVWGHGLNEEQRMSNILQDKLNDFEVLNFGVSGYSTDHYYLLLNKTILDYNSDLVIIGFYANDLEDTGNSKMQDYPKPLFKIENNSLRLTNVPVPKIESLSERIYSSLKKLDLFFSYKSHVYILFKPLLFKIYDLGKNDVYKKYKITTYEIPITKKVYSEEYQSYEELNDKIYCEISNSLKQKNIPLFVVNIPARVHIFPEDFNAILKELNLNKKDYDINKVSLMLRELSEKCDFHFIDLQESFKDYEDKDKLYYKYDVHLTPLGNEYAAEIILKKLENEKLINS